MNKRGSPLDELRVRCEALHESTDARGDVESFQAIDARLRKAFRWLENAITYLNGLKPPIEHRFDLGYASVSDSPRFARSVGEHERRRPRLPGAHRDRRLLRVAEPLSREVLPGWVSFAEKTFDALGLPICFAAVSKRAPRCMASTSAPGARSAIVIAAIAFVLTGCATTYTMMPTPVLYTGENARPLFTELSIDSRRPSLDLLFITDRAPAEQTDDLRYTAGRSRSMRFGSVMIEFGEDVSWDVLVKESTATHRVNPLQLKLGPTTELGRFPAIPYEVTVAPEGVRRVPAVVEAYEKAKQQLQAEIARRLGIARRKEVVLYVHGYHSSFETAALTTGELCHFLGRDFVCGLFTWPAGGGRGIFFGYVFDRESAEYAVEDLLKAIRIVGRTPGVERIHLIAHSRGTDTLASALAALSGEAYTLQSSPDREFHIGNVVLVAPDLDGDVALTKIFKVFSDPDLPFGGKPDPGALIPPALGLRVTLYVSPDDKALATASWLSGSIARLGRVDATAFSADQIEAIALLRAVDIIQVRGTTDFIGHRYFVSNPHVSADIIALLRYGLRPNEPGRPLEQIAGPFWRVPRQ